MICTLHRQCGCFPSETRNPAKVKTTLREKTEKEKIKWKGLKNEMLTNSNISKQQTI